jgi:hypothetical protein
MNIGRMEEWNDGSYGLGVNPLRIAYKKSLSFCLIRDPIREAE